MGGEETLNTSGEETLNRCGEDTLNTSVEDTLNTGGEETLKMGGKETINTGGEETLNTNGEETSNTCGEDVQRRWRRHFEHVRLVSRADSPRCPSRPLNETNSLYTHTRISTRSSVHSKDPQWVSQAQRSTRVLPVACYAR